MYVQYLTHDGSIYQQQRLPKLFDLFFCKVCISWSSRMSTLTLHGQIQMLWPIPTCERWKVLVRSAGSVRAGPCSARLWPLTQHYARPDGDQQAVTMSRLQATTKNNRTHTPPHTHTCVTSAGAQWDPMEGENGGWKWRGGGGVLQQSTNWLNVYKQRDENVVYTQKNQYKYHMLWRNFLKIGENLRGGNMNLKNMHHESHDWLNCYLL